MAIFKFPKLFLSISLAVIALIVCEVSASSRFNEPVQVTSNPGQDFAPAVSPDGKLMVYVSDQSGNLDLWLKYLDPAVHLPDRRLTFHTAEDNSPAFSPDGKSLVFVSHRSDPRGDIYILLLEQSKNLDKASTGFLGRMISGDANSMKNPDDDLLPLTDLSTADADPVWAPDGNGIYYTSIDPQSSQMRIFKIDLKTKVKSPIAVMEGSHPAISPDGQYLAFVSHGKDSSALWVQDLKTNTPVQITSGTGMDMSPRWSPDGRFIYFVSYLDDTNLDDRITIDDRPGIWRIEWGGSKILRQLTDGSNYDLFPVVVGKNLYFSANQKNRTNVWKLPADGMLAGESDYGKTLQMAGELCPDIKGSYRCLMVYRNLIQGHEGEKGLVRIRYFAAKEALALGNSQYAGKIFAELVRLDDSEYKGLAEIELLLLEVAKTKKEGDAVYKKRNREALGALDKILESYAGFPRVSARALLENGGMYLALEESDKAMQFYRKVINEYPGQRAISAEAGFSQSKVYTLVGDHEKLVDSFVQVVREYYDVGYWTRKAINEILNLFEKQPTLEKKVSSLHNLTVEYKSIPLLAGAVQNRIGELYYTANEGLLAKEAYKRTIDQFSQAESERLSAQFALARIYAEEENFEMSLSLYQQISEDSQALEENILQAKSGYVRKSVEKGLWEMRVGEMKLSVKTFLKLIEFSPETTAAHRGYIQSQSALKKIAQVVAFYKARVAGTPKSAVDHYALGLAYTYLESPDLSAAEMEVGEALVLDSQDVYFHQTLGWLYEQKERAKKNEGYLERALQEYQVALALNDDQIDPDNRTNLLLNLGNGHYLLKNYLPAYHYYRERSRGKIGLTDENREAIYYQRFGESAFKSGFSSEAVELYKKALKLVTEKKDPKRIAELNDRIALAYQDGGQYAKAVEYFSRTLELHQETGNTASISRALRNIANNLFSLNQEKESQDTKSLNLALGHYFKAIENLEKYGTGKKAKEKSALIDVNVETALDADASQAATGFDKVGEQKLIFNYIGRIYGDFGEYEKAIEYFQKKLALIPKDLDPKKNVPVILEKAIILNQIGNYYYQSGQYELSAGFFKESYLLSKQLENRRGLAVNSANITRVLLTRSEFVPIRQLRGEMESVLALLEEALAEVERGKNPGSPEHGIYLRNYIGIIYHYLSLHFPAGKPVDAGKRIAPSKDTVLASLAEMQKERDYLKKSLAYFEAALATVRSELKGSAQQKIETGLRQNLELTRHLVGNQKEDKPAKAQENELLHFQWQFKYLESMQKEQAQRLLLLVAAEKSLSRLPYGLLAPDPVSRVMLEELYLSLTQILFEQKRYQEALYYSEKGTQQLLISLRQELPMKFNSEERRKYYEEVKGYTGKILSLSGREGQLRAGVEVRRKEMEKLMDDYAEFISLMREDDRSLAALFSADVPQFNEVMKILGQNDALLKYQKVHDKIFLWLLSQGKLVSGQIPDSPALFESIGRLSRPGSQIQPADLKILSDTLLAPAKGRLAKSKTVYILGNGPLEFLPWSAMSLDGSPMSQKVAISHVTSLSQLFNAQNRKNLYNSRLLAVEFPEKVFTTMADRFASSVNMVGESASVEEFQAQMANYGVVSIDSKTVLGRLVSENTYVSVSRRSNHFEHLRLEDLFRQTMDSNFIALNDVEYGFNPDLGVSPTAPLMEGLDFSGFPSVLMHMGPVDPQIHAEFTELFYGQFRKGSPADSLRLAQKELIQRHPGSYAWAGYRLYGFPGMDEKERNAFAKKNFNGNVEKGGKYFLARDWLPAIAYFEKALGLMDMLPDKGSAPKIYKVLAQAAYNKEDYKKAILYQLELVRLVEKKNSPDELAEAIYFLGILYSRAEDFPKAVEHLQKALAIYQKNEILDKLAESYSTLGIVEENALGYDRALAAFNASLKINDEIGEEANKGRELRRIGRIYYLRLSNYSAARKYFTEANVLFKKLKRTDQVVETLLELGLVFEKEGNFGPALKLYQEAQILTDTKEGQAGLSKALLYQANTYWFQGDYQNAFKFQKRALEVAESLGDKRQQAFIYNTLGLIYWTLNDSTRALTNLHRSLELANEVHSPLDVASAYNNIGLVYRKDKKYPQSIEYFQKALEGDIQIKSKWGQGYTHRNLGMSYMRLGQLDEAEKEIAQAVALSSEIGDRTNLVKAMLEQGHLAVERKAWDKAIPIFQATGKMAEELHIQEVLWRALRGEGLSLIQLRRMDEATQAYKKAVDTVDQMRAAIKVEEFQNGFLTDKQDVYKELVLLLLDQGKVEEAFVFTEKAKSRSFIDLLGNQKINLKNEVSRNLYDKSVQLKQKIRELGETLAQTSDEEGIKRLKEQLVAERTRYQDLLIDIKAQSPDVSSFVTVDTLNLQDLYGLLEEDVALVEYLITDKELVAWVISKGKIDVVRTPVKESELRDLINDHRKRIQQLAPVDDQSIKLYEWVIKPAEKFFKDKRVIGIVPHGHLHYVSFATLRDAEGYLIEKHPLFYTPSASILKFTFKRKFEKTGAIKVLALGNPDLKTMNYDLPLAEMEASSIKWDFSQIDVLTKEKATESWVQKHVGEYQIIHIASHGEFDPINPLFSSLKLTSDTDHDGSLQASEVFALNINADLVTLSACQTGLGDIVGGDELVGLNRAFIYAGTHAIVSTLWRVSDISTAVLIKHLYRNYVAENKGESLRKAQLLVKKLYPHPSYWAGFTLTGDYR